MRGQSWRWGDEKFHATIAQHVLLIQGEQDRLVPLDEAYDMLKVCEYFFEFLHMIPTIGILVWIVLCLIERS